MHFRGPYISGSKTSAESATEGCAGFGSRSIWIGILGICFFFTSMACMVDKSKYLKEVGEKTECRQSLDQCQAEMADLKMYQQVLQREKDRGKVELNALAEKMATLEIERKERIDKISLYEKELEAREAQIAKVTDTYRILVEQLSQEINDGKIRIDQSENRLKLNLVDKILFPSGSADLSARGKEVLEKVGFVLQDMTDRKINIEGHTDNIPLKANLKQRFPSNWELSAMRASAVVRYLQEYVGIDARLLCATGYSMYQPIDTNDTPQGRQANRRIEIILTPLSPQEMQNIYAEPEQPLSSKPDRSQSVNTSSLPADAYKK